MLENFVYTGYIEEWPSLNFLWGKKFHLQTLDLANA